MQVYKHSSCCHIQIHEQNGQKIRSAQLANVYHGSFEAEKFHGKLYMQTFVKKLSWNPGPHIFS